MADRATRVIRTLQRAGFRGDRLKTAFGIVMRESGGNPKAFNPNRSTGDQSYGLFQVNMLGDLGPSRRKQFGLQTNEDLFDPLTNARVAFKMSQGGRDFGPWGIGPNAYRTGAGMETIQPFLKGFPAAATGAGNRPPAAPSLPAAPGAKPSLAFALKLIASHRDETSPILAALQAIQEREPPSRPKPTKRKPVRKLQSHEGVLALPATWEGTHPTDELGWGTSTARDILADPGTPVGAPEDATVVYFHPTGAQGGGSMLLRTKSGREIWLGHIDQGLPEGTKVRQGQPIAVVSSDHPTPHVHIDWRRV